MVKFKHGNMDSLSLDSLGVIRDFVGKESYLSFGILARDFYELWDYYPKYTRALTKDTTIVFLTHACLLYTSPSPRDLSTSRMPSSA